MFGKCDPGFSRITKIHSRILDILLPCVIEHFITEWKRMERKNMKTVYEMNELIRRVLPEVFPAPEERYRPISFCVRYDMTDGVAIYNTMTKELLILEGEEAKALDETQIESETARELVRRYFLVPTEHDDCALADEINELTRKIGNHYIDGKLTGFTILTTTDCNARCYYCYEAGIKRIAMTEQIAHEVAAFIARKARTNKVRLHWFGGEPLYNYPAIDVICSDLTEKGFTFVSDITSNAFLWTEELVERAKEKWNLRTIQITLDGTEKVYNATKDYIDLNGENAFERVMRNIVWLAENDVFVSIRLNLGRDNYNDLVHLVDYLVNLLGDRKNYRIYAHLLFDIEQGNDVELRTVLTKRIEALEIYIDERMPVKNTFIDRTASFVNCQASGGSAVVIGPEGELYPCEHINECESCGTIWDDSHMFDHVEEWQELMPREDLCQNCVKYPICFRKKLCPAMSFHCIEAVKDRSNALINQQIKNEIDEFLLTNMKA